MFFKLRDFSVGEIPEVWQIKYLKCQIYGGPVIIPGVSLTFIIIQL